MTKTEKKNLIKFITKEIERDTLYLPSLPSVARDVRDALNQYPNISAQDISDIIVTDPALSAYLIKVANSSLYSQRGRKQNSIKGAISLLGNECAVNLITIYSIKQVFTSPSDLYTSVFVQTLNHSLSVSAICHGLASFSANINPDTAMLAGLVHQIGKLPALTFLSKGNHLLPEDQLNDILAEIHPQMGQLILESWHFPEELISVPNDYLNFSRQSGHELDYTDIVTAAYLQECMNSPHPHGNIDWSKVAAFSKLGLILSVDDTECKDLIKGIESRNTILP